VPTPELLTSDDLDALGHDDAGDPAAVADELVAAVDDGRVAEPGDISYALALAADKREAAGDLDAALALADRAVEAERTHGDPDNGWPRAGRARLLALAGRTDEAYEEVSALRPLLLTDAGAAAYLREALQAAGRGDEAQRWLTEALTTALGWGEDIDEERAAVAYQLAVQRHDLRHDLGLPHDDLDDMAEELLAEADDEPAPDGSVVMFWPRDDFAALGEAGAADEGGTWDEHRAGIEAVLAEWSAAGTTGLGLVPGSYDDLVAYARQRDAAPDDEEVLDDYVESLSASDRVVQWPPGRNDPCWCGSGAKYKRCCLPRSR
jgi:tetratricopeptide (TPR) repeat protein